MRAVSGRAARLLPGAAVPAQDQGLGGAAVGVTACGGAAYCPGAACGQDGHCVEGAASRSRAGHRLPRGAVPLQDRGLRRPLANPVAPTAQALRADTAATPNRKLPVPGAGLGTCFHEAPFHRSIRVPPLPVTPTAQALAADAAATPKKMLPAGAGLGTAFHDVPFHRRIKGCIDGVPQWLHPAAQARRAETAARPLRELPAGAGLGARFHDLPFQCRIRALPPVVRVVPAAQASRAVTAATASSPPPSGAGLSTCFQEIPFHRSIRVLDLLPQLQCSRRPRRCAQKRRPRRGGLRPRGLGSAPASRRGRSTARSGLWKPGRW